MKTDRRTFIELIGAGALGAYTSSIRKALAIPAHHRTGTIRDVEHIVILMQENRSFDHYFGTLRGVRGFGDPRAVKLPSGKPVWNQPDGASEVLPFRPDTPQLGQEFLEGTPHNWNDTQGMFNRGAYDQWIPWKTRASMTHYVRDDIPFHFALADAFTVCDAYHCSFMGATDPNRYHMWTGWVGNDGQGGGPVLDNSEAGYDWKTYPERLLEAGVTWKIYQDAGAGLDGPHFWGWGPDPYIGNYGDNSLLYFHQYQNSLPGTPLHDAAFNATNIFAGGTLFDQFRADVASGNLPQVSWIIAPETYSEHSNWPANYGAWYVSQMLDALTDHPEVWSKTVFFLMYDENDGYFDHVVPPTPPLDAASGASTVDASLELMPGDAKFVPGAVGLGQRVPMIVISPWSKGGWVNSQVFDHTSLIRFIEERFGVYEPNITPWRRAVTGDLTSAFDFKRPNADVVPLPATSGYAPLDSVRHPDFIATVPFDQALPEQEPGVRPARAVPYRVNVESRVDTRRQNISLQFVNKGEAAAVFQVRSLVGGFSHSTYTVSGHMKLGAEWSFPRAPYELGVYGPNGFFRGYKGDFSQGVPNLDVHCGFEKGGVILEVKNRGDKLTLEVWDAYRQTSTRHEVPRGKLVWFYPLNESAGWYDLTIHVVGNDSYEVQFAGHVETGKPSFSDPAFGA
jgi:phospholipase C